MCRGPGGGIRLRDPDRCGVPCWGAPVSDSVSIDLLWYSLSAEMRGGKYEDTGGKVSKAFGADPAEIAGYEGITKAILP